MWPPGGAIYGPNVIILTNLGEAYMLTPIHVITIIDNMDWGQHVSEISSN